MSNLFNQQFDPSDETEEEFGGKLTKNKVHIRIQQRNGRKTITTLQGIDEKYEQKKLAKAFKKEFNCNGTVVEDEQYGEVIQLSGDQRNNIQQFLIDVGICKKDGIVVHGF
ncbi:eukaryotic translation initiation factor 1b [Hydra vulgaris]|uniref:Eukaryotic translation initiation factor 1b n=1 Tax=Hydra vulgaris TaxID=6087 RepID=T2MIW5_HYDVU|nr:eukaryotic translation initiation factor 1 [Hydra vulgaris]